MLCISCLLTAIMMNHTHFHDDNFFTLFLIKICNASGLGKLGSFLSSLWSASLITAEKKVFFVIDRKQWHTHHSLKYLHGNCFKTTRPTSWHTHHYLFWWTQALLCINQAHHLRSVQASSAPAAFVRYAMHFSTQLDQRLFGAIFFSTLPPMPPHTQIWTVNSDSADTQCMITYQSPSFC